MCTNIHGSSVAHQVPKQVLPAGLLNQVSSLSIQAENDSNLESGSATSGLSLPDLTQDSPVISQAAACILLHYNL